MQTNNAYIVSSVRTPVGKANRGALRHFRPEEMGAEAVREAIRRVDDLEPEAMQDVIMGCAFPEGAQGMNMGRIIAQKAGLPDEVPGMTVNRFCSSGLQSIVFAANAIESGQYDCAVAGGAESMSQVPMSGFHFQPDPETVDDDIDAYVSMGITAENVAGEYGVSREGQDAFALRSHERAVDAIDSGRFEAETVPVEVEETLMNGHREPETIHRTVDTDEGPRRDTSMEVLATLPSAFKKGGTVTPGNASQRSDGAAATVV
ncbi:MAG: acetyl-CoA C-acyltransferase, partial [Bacteroidetes bacterium QS_8_64_10]